MTYDDKLNIIIQKYIDLIDKKDWHTLYRNVRFEDSYFTGKLTEALWSADIHPEEDLTKLPDEFLGYSTITEWTIPDNIKQLGKYCFHSSELKKIHIPDSVYDIGDGCFYASDIEELKLPEELDVIPPNMCEGCEELRKVYIPKNLQRISGKAFARCYELSDVSKLPETLLGVGEAPFDECWSLRELSYESTTDEYNISLDNIRKGSVIETIHCDDGDIDL